LGRKVIADALRKAGASVEVHDDHFEPATPDARWLSEVGRRGWVVLSKDSRIRSRTLERNALLHARVAAFILTSQDMTGQDMAKLFVDTLPKLHRYLIKRRRPFIALISQGGTITTL
jgi:hypothetical protein